MVECGKKNRKSQRMDGVGKQFLFSIFFTSMGQGLERRMEI